MYVLRTVVHVSKTTLVTQRGEMVAFTVNSTKVVFMTEICLCQKVAMEVHQTTSSNLLTVAVDLIIVE
jgi:hypothetical protein